MKNSFVVSILVALTFQLGFSPIANAQAGESNSVQMLTYAQLMELPTESRIQYIEGVRTILIDLSKRSDGKFSDRDPAVKSRLKAWLEMLDREMKTARAADGDNSGEAAPVPIRLRKPSGSVSAPAEPTDPVTQRIMDLGSNRASTSPTDDITNYVTRSDLDATKFGCLSSARHTNSPRTAGLQPCSPEIDAKITQAFQAQKPKISILSADSPRALTRGLTVGDKTISGAPTGAPPTEQPAAAGDPIGDFAQRTQTTDQGPPPIVLTPAVVRVTPGETTETSNSGVGRRVTIEEITKYVAEKHESPGKMCGDGMQLVQIASGKDSYCLTSEAEARFKAGELKLGGDAAGADVPGKRGRKTASQDGTSDAAASKRGEEKKYACAPKPQVCESNAKTVYKPGQHCIFAGLLSTFNSGNTRCQPQLEFAIGSQKYSCASGQTMCNPLLFGTVDSTTPICIGRANNATEQCSKLSSSRDAEKFLVRSGNGIQEKWDQFTTSLENICSDKKTDTVKFHCAECNIIRTRIFDLRARLVKDPCGDGGTARLENAIKNIHSRPAKSDKIAR